MLSTLLNKPISFLFLPRLLHDNLAQIIISVITSLRKTGCCGFVEDLCALISICFQIVVSGVAVAPGDVAAYASCTMLAASMSRENSQTEELIDACIQFLQENEFVLLKTETNDGSKEISFHCSEKKTFCVRYITQVSFAFVFWLFLIPASAP